ncbi:hypothetical protein RJ640_015977 [Escallonia rubra]|uniref:Chlororespiratory reduction 4 n=1 Tax=Escallonia rubra TaxID=112253 RepID=A0AA88S5X7_9ASTE|nr:hypothetical protein RJ640_015977 [Escallonia rubra]
MLACANPNQPWSSILPTLLLFPNCKTQLDINQIHARMLTTGFIKNPSLSTKLVLTFCSSPNTPLIQFARYIFFCQPALQNPSNQRDPFLWNATIKTFSHGEDDPTQAVAILSLMLENGVCVDKFTFSLVLKACSRMGLLKEGMQIHGLLRKFEFGSNVFLQNCLVCLYVKCGCVEYARQVFDRILERDSVSFNLMINGYVKSGMMDSASDLFDSMPLGMKNLISWNTMISGCVDRSDYGFKVAWELFEKMPKRDLVSWNLMIECCAKCGEMETARVLFDTMPERDVVSWANMIDGYAKLGSVDIARALFDDMPERDVISCNVMMAGYVQNGHCMEALKVFHGILKERALAPDNTTLLIALSAIAQLGGYIDEGIAVHSYIEEHGFSVDGKLGVALIDMYAKSGSAENAMWVFERVEEKMVDHWNAIIGGLAIHGLGVLAFDLFMEMERHSIKPDDITFIGVLNACGHAGLVKEGMICFEIMRRIHKMEPKLQHYGCMVDIRCKAGHLEEATRFMEKMPIEPTDVVWRILLSACKNYENINIGEPVAKHLIALNSYDSSSYVLLSNVYACFGMWDYVRRVRRILKKRHFKKIPGCSRIELEGTVHEFVVGDRFHPQVEEIYATLNITSTLNSEVTCSGL